VVPRFSRAQDAAYRLLTRLAGSNLPPEALGLRILAALQAAIPSDGQQLMGVDPASLLFNRLLAVSPGMAAHTRWYLKNRYLDEPVRALDHPELMRAGYTALALHDRPENSHGAPGTLLRCVDARDWQSLYHASQGPAGGVLRAYFADDGAWVAALVLARFDARPTFTSGDVLLLRRVAPLVARMLRLSIERERAQRHPAGTTPDASGILMLGPDGRVRLSTPAGEAWLEVLQGLEAGTRDRLPTGIWTTLAAWRAQRGGRLFPAVRVPTPTGILRLEASAADARDSVAIVLSRECPPAAPEIPASWPLSAQERRVLALVLRGHSNQEIAASLLVSEHTVESHLGHAYEKLGIHSRGQFLARLFRETYWPTLEAPP
jgi:DNA-binding CsgD family transcriptional regulator